MYVYEVTVGSARNKIARWLFDSSVWAIIAICIQFMIPQHYQDRSFACLECNRFSDLGPHQNGALPVFFFFACFN